MERFMRSLRHFKTISRILFLLGLIFIFPSIAAADPLERSGLWGSLALGAGHVQRAFAEDETSFFLGFAGGYAIHPNVLAGLELSGWTLENRDFNRPNKGEGIMQAFLVSRIYLKEDLGWFGKVGGGYISHWNNRPGESSRKDGWGLVVGGGYDFQINSSWAITPLISYHVGESGNLDHDIITFSLGLTLF
jgi:hypothetical protein